MKKLLALGILASSFAFADQQFEESPTLISAQAAEKSAEEIEAEAIAEKSGEMGKCIGRTPDEFGGYIYHFELREKCTEDFAILMMWSHDLGYSCGIDWLHVSVPDLVALEARDAKIAEKWPSWGHARIFRNSGEYDDKNKLDALYYSAEMFHYWDRIFQKK